MPIQPSSAEAICKKFVNFMLRLNDHSPSFNVNRIPQSHKNESKEYLPLIVLEYDELDSFAKKILSSHFDDKNPAFFISGWGARRISKNRWVNTIFIDYKKNCQLALLQKHFALLKLFIFGSISYRHCHDIAHALTLYLSKICRLNLSIPVTFINLCKQSITFFKNFHERRLYNTESLPWSQQDAELLLEHINTVKNLFCMESPLLQPFFKHTALPAKIYLQEGPKSTVTTRSNFFDTSSNVTLEDILGSFQRDKELQEWLADLQLDVKLVWDFEELARAYDNSEAPRESLRFI